LAVVFTVRDSIWNIQYNICMKTYKLTVTKLRYLYNTSIVLVKSRVRKSLPKSILTLVASSPSFSVEGKR